MSAQKHLHILHIYWIATYLKVKNLQIGSVSDRSATESCWFQRNVRKKTATPSCIGARARVAAKSWDLRTFGHKQQKQLTFVDSREQAQLYNFRVVGCRFKKKVLSKVKWQQKKISKGTYIVCIAFWNIVYLCLSDVEWPIEDKIQKGEYIQHFRDFKKQTLSLC